MEKFIAFNVYGRNEYGAAVTRVLPDGEEKAVYLASDVEKLLQALRDASVGLDTWLNTYASDHCDVANVEAAYRRIEESGGTLAYIARLQAAIKSLMVK